MPPPVSPAPLIKWWGQKFNLSSFLWGTYRNSFFQFPLCSRGFNNVRRVSCQSKSMPIKIQSHPLFVYLFPCGKIFLPMYLTHECSEVSKRDLGIHGGNGGIPSQGHHWETCFKKREALKDSLEQDEPFPAKRISKRNKRASVCTSEPKGRMPRADTVIYHTYPQMHLSISQHVFFLHRSEQNKPIEGNVRGIIWIILLCVWSKYRTVPWFCF